MVLKVFLNFFYSFRIIEDITSDVTVVIV